MPEIDWNRSYWNRKDNFPGDGEGWSGPWGGSEAQWFSSLYPRLHRVLPAKKILEIAPGHGRWTKFLLSACTGYVGIDLSEECIESCRRRFTDATHARFATNDGVSLAAAPDGVFDLIFSFDSLVHAEFTVFESYIPQIVRKLCPGGICFIHHSNLAAVGDIANINTHLRSDSVSAMKIVDLIARSGGKILIQEVINWVDTKLIDCLSTFGRYEDFIGFDPIHRTNPHFMNEANIIRQHHVPYGRIPPAND